MNAKDIEERAERVSRELPRMLQQREEALQQQVSEAKRRAAHRVQLEREREASLRQLIAERRAVVQSRLKRTAPSTVAHKLASWELKQLDAGVLPATQESKLERQADVMVACMLGFEPGEE